MIDNFEKILSALRGVSLSVRERTNMRIHLEAHMREHPLNASFGARARTLLINLASRVTDALNSRTVATHPAFAACVLVLCIGLGTSYAAERALPGQALYSFKIRVNEPVQGVLALSPAAKAEWSAQLTNRRLIEAEELAATNQLSPVVAADIERGLDSALRNFNSNVTLLAKGEDAEATNAQSELEASLNAHEVVLTSLSSAKDNDTSGITAKVRKHAENLNQERSSSEAQFITATDSPKMRKAALNRQKSAQTEVDNAQLLSQTILDTRVASSVASITEYAKKDIRAGNRDAKHGQWGKAYVAFQDAILKMKETQDGVDTRNWLKKRFGIGLNSASTTQASTTTVIIDSTSNQEDSNKKPKKEEH